MPEGCDEKPRCCILELQEKLTCSHAHTHTHAHTASQSVPIAICWCLILIIRHVQTSSSGESDTSCAALAQRMRALEGTQPTLRQSPPIRCSSTIATLAPTPAAPAAVTNPPAPAPITTRLYLHHEVPVCAYCLSVEGKHEGIWPDLLFCISAARMLISSSCTQQVDMSA